MITIKTMIPGYPPLSGGLGVFAGWPSTHVPVLNRLRAAVPAVCVEVAPLTVAPITDVQGTRVSAALRERSP